MTARTRLRTLRRRLYDTIRPPITTAQEDADYEVLHQAVVEMRSEKAAAADKADPHQPVTTVHRPGIYVDAAGQTWVRDRWGTKAVGETSTDTTEMEAV